jgi:hypothetical protein
MSSFLRLGCSAAAILVLGLTACSSERLPQPDVCTVGTLAEVGQGCPATFAGDLQTMPCASSWENRRAFTCDGLDVVRKQGPSGELRCNYDAASHALVGAERSASDNACRSGSWVQAGRVPEPTCTEDASTTLTFCPGQCTRPLSEIGATCPPTFDGNLGALPCGSPEDLERVDECGDLRVLWNGPQLGGPICSYDAASHALVGAKISGDLAFACDATSFVATAGRLPPDACLGGAPTARRTCPGP